MGKEALLKTKADKADKIDFETLKPLLKIVFPELNEDLVPGLPADLIRKEKIKRKLNIG